VPVNCDYAEGAGHVHEIADGARRLALRFDVDWGDDDLRNSFEKPMVFCSFNCLSAWAQGRADQHDGVTVKDGD
jgi:hypothetical protein